MGEIKRSGSWEEVWRKRGAGGKDMRGWCRKKEGKIEGRRYIKIGWGYAWG